MTTRGTALLAAVLITGISLAGAAGAGAQELDHLLCVTVKDDANLRGREDITIFAAGCTVNVLTARKIKTICAPADSSF